MSFVVGRASFLISFASLGASVSLFFSDSERRDIFSRLTKSRFGENLIFGHEELRYEQLQTKIDSDDLG